MSVTRSPLRTYISTRAVAELLGAPTRTIRFWGAKGVLPKPRRLLSRGRLLWDRAAVEAFAARLAAPVADVKG
jgi:predicted DNA-binding transcriptional regulator AlpA